MGEYVVVVKLFLGVVGMVDWLVLEVLLNKYYVGMEEEDLVQVGEVLLELGVGCYEWEMVRNVDFVVYVI
ncbi:hypothetical protein [Staphylococcus epidermidis]|uniref:hypothetical protein n=1 Tax=Staphylococcus epidermidis TaxID=1282 RepID=UPI0011AB27CD|nr:hypothetical protein [Staphylococcus epidermidis]